MSKRKIFRLLFAILIIASFLRLYHFTNVPPGLYPDEAMDGNNALEAVHTGAYRVFYVEDNGREGLYANVVALLTKALGGLHEPWVIRLPAAVSGILTVLGIYFLGAELFSADVGLLSAFLLATSFWHITFSRIGFRAIMAPLLLVWAVYFLIKALRCGGGKTAAILSVAGGIVYGLGFYTYIAYRVTPLLVALIAVWFWKKFPSAERKKVLFSVLSFLVFSFLVALPIGIYFLHNPGDFFGRTSQISVSGSASPARDLLLNIVKTLAMFNFRGDGNWRHNISGAPELFWPVGILFLIGMAAAAGKLLKHKRNLQTLDLPQAESTENFGPLLIFMWFLLAMLPVVLSNEGIPHALRSILLLPPAMLFASIGGLNVYGILRRSGYKKLLKTTAAAFLATLAIFAYMQYFVVWAENPNVPGAFNADYVSLGRELNSLPAGLPKYVVVEAGGVPVRGIPTPAQTVMYITDTFLARQQNEKNIRYVLPAEANKIPPGAFTAALK